MSSKLDQLVDLASTAGRDRRIFGSVSDFAGGLCGSVGTTRGQVRVLGFLPGTGGSGARQG